MLSPQIREPIGKLAFISPIFLLIEIIRRLWFSLDSVELKLRWSSGKRKAMYLGGFFVMIVPTMGHFEKYGIGIPTAGNLLVAVYIFLLSKAISQQKLLDFSVFLVRFGVYFVVGLSLALIYMLLYTVSSNQFPVLFLNSLLVSILFVVAINPLKKAISKTVDSLILYANKGFSKQVSILKSRIIEANGLEETQNNIESGLSEIFDTDRINIYYRTKTGFDLALRPERAEKVEMIIPKRLIEDNSLLKYCDILKKKGELPLALGEIIDGELARSISKRQTEHLNLAKLTLNALGGDLAIPFYSGEKLMALAVIDRGLSEPMEWGYYSLLKSYIDICSDRIASQEIYTLQRETERLAELGQLSAAMAHEIRNPLGSIRGAAQCLDGDFSETNQKFIHVIIEEVDRLNGVVNQFLDYSRGEDTTLKNIKLFDLANLIEKVIKNFQLRASGSLEIKYNYEGTPLEIEGNPADFQSLLVNLLLNAVDASEIREKPVIEVELTGVDPAGVLIAVRDNGCGMDGKTVASIFKPFYTTKTKGTGLGLSISDKIVRNYGGSITVSTDKGKYTEFRVNIPRNGF